MFGMCMKLSLCMLVAICVSRPDFAPFALLLVPRASGRVEEGNSK